MVSGNAQRPATRFGIATGIGIRVRTGIGIRIGIWPGFGTRKGQRLGFGLAVFTVASETLAVQPIPKVDVNIPQLLYPPKFISVRAI